MKLLIRDYLGSLRERDELDAILPDLLSELGFHVYSRPQRGTSQLGVDIAAVGKDDDGERKLFLFSVKQGDLTRQDWDGTPQALRSSLGEILDAYIPHRIPNRYKELKIVICLAFGGGVNEQVREKLTGFIARNTTARVTFDEWNGDKIAGMILKGILREEILPKPLRSSFQKAVAMIDEPDVSYEHFSRLARDLRQTGTVSGKARVRAARQLNICLWILFVWARSAGNIESPYRASELALLTAWELLRPTLGSSGREIDALSIVVRQMIELHLTISMEFIESRVLPYAKIRHGISMAIGSHSSLDVNLALFEVLGRIGLAGLWLHWIGERGDEAQQEQIRSSVVQLTQTGLELIRNNPILFLPIADRQGTSIALFLQLWLVSELDATGITSWLEEMARRLTYSIHTRGRYTSSLTDYRDLAEHPRDRSDEYFKEAMAGSTIVPLLAAWLHALGATEAVEALSRLAQEELKHCTFQLWLPDASSEENLYVGNSSHGRALCGLPLNKGGCKLIATIAEACSTDTGLQNLSPIKSGFWPLVMVACHHHELPIPPGFWISSLMEPEPELEAD
ncbi:MULTISPECIES: chemotaxis protein [Pseudomonas]|uniref:Chemotaxis protein n=1 Tax=Pseudomonas plecoglossicida TaxID=70775 RepID=A0ABX4TTM5_PSEDL|nr:MULTISPECIES: chemotaxis protein [Pseudomonas]PLU84321.1 chemotaxis protein [Pseudomonas plecoglossicida]PLU89585.1 chemotaxis protein [Pseudomonas plecoglossicida]PLU97650.1 chemotaxis protein [Pseudomonas plecoglossicida]PLV07560.1 chemotaxis protein [Pseudomonas plecoglossicida]